MSRTLSAPPLLALLCTPALVALFSSTPAQASQTLTGEVIRIGYNDNGTWNNADDGVGFQVDLEADGTFNDWTWPGIPFQMFAVEYVADGEGAAYWASSSPDYTGEDTITATSEEDASSPVERVAVYEYEAGTLLLAQEQRWTVDAQVLAVEWELTNAGEVELEDLRLLFSVDVDQEYAIYSLYMTENDVVDTDGDGLFDLVQSVGAYTFDTMAFGACDPDRSVLGHYASWSTTTEVDVTLSDRRGASADEAMALRFVADEALAPGDSATVRLLVLVGDDAEDVQDLWAASEDLCAGCEDVDEDGYTDETCGGTDCDDLDEAVHPDAAETWYDGTDQDCDGRSDYDADGDDAASEDWGGVDCDDADPTVYPGADETWYDGVDQDCAGDSDYDADGDLHDALDGGGEDCDDLDPSIHPDAAERWYDGIDQDCDGMDDFDADMDGDRVEGEGGGDCDDADPTISSLSAETWYDGTDQDCDERSDYDADLDGADAVAWGGDDCDDADPTIYVGAVDTWYDGTDQDCGGNDDYDADEDGDRSAGHGGGDCNEADPAVSSLVAETWYDGLDQDCDGESDYDADQDGHDSEAWEGDDCDDGDGAIHPDATDIPLDGIDQDCDGEDATTGTDGGATDGGGTDGGATDGGGDGGGDGGDGGDDGDEDDDSKDGCLGCASAATPAGGMGWALGLVALIGLRRRR